MDIFEYIDRVKANFDKQPEPRYNTKKYFTDNVDNIGPGPNNRNKIPRLNVMPETYNSEEQGSGVMIDPRGLQDGKIPLPTQGLNEGGIATPKRGFVDEPGSYGGLKKDGTPKSEYMIKGSRLPKGKLTLYNKYAQLFFNKDWKDLTETESEKVENASRKGKFIKTNKFDQLTDLNQEKIKKAFPDIKFEFKPGQKLGVPKTLPNGKLNPVNDAVSKFIRRGYKKSLRKSLPVSIQRDIVANFELPKGVKEWNFDVNQGGNTYGIPDTGQNNAKNRNLGARIKRFVENPINYKVAADYSTPDGWLLNQMYRAHLYNDNYIPKYDLINGKKKIVAFTDNQFGKGKTYYALKKYANKFNGILMSEHPDYQNTKKYISIANKARLSPNEVIKDLLIKGGVKDDRITLNTLLNFIINKKGVEPTKRALVLHHKGGMSSPTRDFQILNAAVNQNIVGIERAMRSNPKNITPENIKKLKDFGASITIDGKTYGGGPKTAIGGFKQAEQFVEQKLKDFGNKDFKNLSKYLKKIGCPDLAAGGRVGFRTGANCMVKGVEAINSGKFAKGAQSRNAAKFLNAAMNVGNKAYKGVRWLSKYGVVPEMVFIGADSLIRMGMGDTLSESLQSATSYLPGGTKREGAAELSKLSRRVGSENAKIILNARNYQEKQNYVSSLEEQRDSDLAFAGTDFAETNSGESRNQINKRYDTKIKDAKADAIMSSVGEAEARTARNLEDEALDIRKTEGVTSRLQLLANEMGDIEDESLLSTDAQAPVKTQAQLNQNILPSLKYQHREFGFPDSDSFEKFKKADKDYIINLAKSSNYSDKEIENVFKMQENARKADPKNYSLEELANIYGSEQAYGASGNFGTYIPDPVRDGLRKIAIAGGVSKLASGGMARVGYGIGGAAKVYQLLRGVNKTKPLKGLEEKLIKQYKSEGMEFIEAIKKAQIEAAGIRYESKMKIINDAMKDTNVYSDDYVDLLDMKIKLEDPDFAKDYMNFSETLKNKTRARTDEGWAKANFGENYSEQMDIARSKEINESIDPNFKEPLSPSDQMASDIDDMNKANIDEIIGGRKKNATGGLANLTRTIPPERGPNSQGLASFMKNGKR